MIRINVRKELYTFQNTSVFSEETGLVFFEIVKSDDLEKENLGSRVLNVQKKIKNCTMLDNVVST